MTAMISNWRRALMVFGYTMTTTPQKAPETPSAPDGKPRARAAEA